MNDHSAHAALSDTALQTASDKARIAAQREQLARYAAIKASGKVGVIGRVVAWVKGMTA